MMELFKLAKGLEGGIPLPATLTELRETPLSVR